MSAIRPNRTGRAGLLMSVDRGRPEVSGIRSTRRDQPLTDGHFTIFGFQVQSGMLIALAIIAVAIAFAWLANR
jgi:hypothetical protein